MTYNYMWALSEFLKKTKAGLGISSYEQKKGGVRTCITPLPQQRESHEVHLAASKWSVDSASILKGEDICFQGACQLLFPKPAVCAVLFVLLDM